MSRWIRYILFCMVLLSCACDFKPPLEARGHEPEVVSIAYLKSLYGGVPVKIRKEISIEGRVVANDRWSNFYRSIVVQDATGGLEVKLEADELFLLFPYGEKVRINCNGLALGAYGGTVQLGVVSDDTAYETGYIPVNRIFSTIKVIPRMSAEPIPVPFTIAHLYSSQFDAARYVGRLVRLSGVQFAESDAALTWAEGATGATSRILTDIHGNELDVRTNAKASFAGDLLPVGSGAITGILGWFNGRPQLMIYDPREVDMDASRF